MPVMKHSSKNPKRSERAQIIVVLALVLPVLIGAMAMSADVGLLLLQLAMSAKRGRCGRSSRRKLSSLGLHHGDLHCQRFRIQKRNSRERNNLDYRFGRRPIP